MKTRQSPSFHENMSRRAFIGALAAVAAAPRGMARTAPAPAPPL